jgi:hypothetical protein
MHKVAANYTLPTILNTLKPAATNAGKSARRESQPGHDRHGHFGASQ